VNLSQGFPDFSAPPEIKEAARQAIADDINQYAITWGAKPLREAIVEKFGRTQGVRFDPEREITICCGSTEAMMSTMLAIINPGDEIVVFEPFYENYGPDAILSGATPRFVKLRPPDWSYDEAELQAAFGPYTKARPTIPPGRSSRAPNWSLSVICACAGTPTALPTKSTNTFCTMARNTFPWHASTACVTAPS
jgi:aminotransferase